MRKDYMSMGLAVACLAACAPDNAKGLREGTVATIAYIGATARPSGSMSLGVSVDYAHQVEEELAKLDPAPGSAEGG